MLIINKNIGETPLEVLNNYKKTLKEDDLYELTEKKNKKKVKFSYAGRLDPMARGKMIILRGLECKNQDLYCDLDKEYEFEILFNFKTDTYDILGLLEKYTSINYSKIDDYLISENIRKYIGIYNQEYPPYSSYCINGKPLWELTKMNINPIIPKKLIEIYELKYLGFNIYDQENIYNLIFNKIHSLSKENHKNFRVIKILNKWFNFFNNNYNKEYRVYKFRAKVSSGTYIRSLVNRMGNDLGIGAITLDINRINFYSKDKKIIY